MGDTKIKPGTVAKFSFGAFHGLVLGAFHGSKPSFQTMNSNHGTCKTMERTKSKLFTTGKFYFSAFHGLRPWFQTLRLRLRTPGLCSSKPGGSVCSLEPNIAEYRIGLHVCSAHIVKYRVKYCQSGTVGNSRSDDKVANLMISPCKSDDKVANLMTKSQT